MLASFSLLLLTLFFRIEFATVSATKHQQHPPLCHENERSALLQFKHSFSINYSSTIDAFLQAYADDTSAAYPKMLSWNSNSTLGVDGDDCCRWDGVECDPDTGHVIALDLCAGCLYGSIDSSSTLFQLLHLRRLNLAYNYFNYSHIPSQIGHLSRLTHLNLSHSSFSGPIPTQISELSNLVTLSFSGNPLLWLPQNLGLGGLVQNLTSIQSLHLKHVNVPSTVPDSFANLPSLASLVLDDCGLHGQFPASIFNLPNIRRLDIAQNENLTGFLPDFKASSLLRILFLSDTNFSGEIPNSIGNLGSLESLDIGFCRFFGSIPDSLSNLTQLTQLWISGNNFTQGNFPPWIGKLHQLHFLSLGLTNLIGAIPSTLANLTRLSNLKFGSNKLTGSIPSWLGNLTHLKYLDAGGNALLGTLPISIFDLANLEFLDISDNSLSGKLEFEKFANLKNLKALQLSYNKLSVLSSTGIHNATLPNFTILELALCNLSGFPNFLQSQNKLQVLDLEGNNICGLIPNWIQSLSNKSLIAINLANNCLTGFQQSPIFLPWERLQVLILKSNKLQGMLPIPPPSIILYQASNNSFTGNLSPMLLNLENLQVFDVSHNNLHGTIPNSFKRGSQLRTINLSRNNFGGPLPRSLANCKILEILDIGNNEINDTFPSWLGVILKLHILDISFNQFHGFIKNFNNEAREDMYFPFWNGMKISNTGELTYMASSVTIKVHMLYLGVSWIHTYDVEDSMMVNMKGVVTQYANIPRAFKMIDLSNNRFVGWIPNSIGDLKGLHLVNLSNNGFIGSIPLSFGKLSDLESLDLSHNKLWGSIPEQLMQLTFLEVFDVCYNNMSGSIPKGNQFDTFENDSYIGNTGLCGYPLLTKCGILSVKVKEEYLSNSFRIDWLIMGMGYASGLIVGLVIGTFFIK